MSMTRKVVKWHGQMQHFLHKPKSKLDPHFRAKKNLGPKRGDKQGELAGTRTCLKCIPKGWLVMATNAESHDLVLVL
jgi:hypothetical protein